MVDFASINACGIGLLERQQDKEKYKTKTIDEIPGEILFIQETGAGIYGPPQMIINPCLELTMHHVTLVVGKG